MQSHEQLSKNLTSSPVASQREHWSFLPIRFRNSVGHLHGSKQQPIAITGNACSRRVDCGSGRNRNTPDDDRLRSDDMVPDHAGRCRVAAVAWFRCGRPRFRCVPWVFVVTVSVAAGMNKNKSSPRWPMWLGYRCRRRGCCHDDVSYCDQGHALVQATPPVLRSSCQSKGRTRVRQVMVRSLSQKLCCPNGNAISKKRLGLPATNRPEVHRHSYGRSAQNVLLTLENP